MKKVWLSCFWKIVLGLHERSLVSLFNINDDEVMIGPFSLLYPVLIEFKFIMLCILRGPDIKPLQSLAKNIFRK